MTEGSFFDYMVPGCFSNACSCVKSNGSNMIRFQSRGFAGE